jgi:FMN phosphatase YigB (HAD superfamily)
MPIATLLLDLDDTLLDTNVDEFVPAYFQALSAALADVVAPEVMLPALMGGTKAMMANQDPAQTLQEVFDAFFFPRLGTDREALQQRIDDFYETGFPKLQGVTRARPEAVEFVDWARSAGYRLAIATNPFFPLRAVQHRLHWAGLPVEQYDFALVSSYETFHFTKESVAYFPEVLGQLGWLEAPAVMVGNDLQMDLLPARQAGLPVFWVGGRELPGEDLPHGSLSALRQWLERTDPATLMPALESPAAILACMTATPAVLDSLTRPLPPEGWKCNPEPGEWRLTEILCHLRDVEREVNLPRLNKILADDNPFLTAAVSDAWVSERQYARQDGRQALREFTSARKQALSLLDPLKDEWLRPARHAIFGPTTLKEQTGILAGHDRAHIQQVWKTIGR